MISVSLQIIKDLALNLIVSKLDDSVILRRTSLTCCGMSGHMHYTFKTNCSSFRELRAYTLWFINYFLPEFFDSFHSSQYIN